MAVWAGSTVPSGLGVDEADAEGLFGAAPEVGEFTAQVTANNPHIKFFNSSDHGYNIMKAVRTLPSPDNPTPTASGRMTPSRPQPRS